MSAEPTWWTWIPAPNLRETNQRGKKLTWVGVLKRPANLRRQRWGSKSREVLQLNAGVTCGEIAAQQKSGAEPDGKSDVGQTQAAAAIARYSGASYASADLVESFPGQSRVNVTTAEELIIMCDPDDWTWFTWMWLPCDRPRNVLTWPPPPPPPKKRRPIWLIRCYCYFRGGGLLITSIIYSLIFRRETGIALPKPRQRPPWV